MLEQMAQTELLDLAVGKMDDQPVVIGPPTRFANRISRKISIRKSNSISERRAWSNMTLTVISGNCRIEIGEECVELDESAALEIPAHVDHRILALSDVRAIVTFDAVPKDQEDA